MPHSISYEQSRGRHQYTEGLGALGRPRTRSPQQTPHRHQEKPTSRGRCMSWSVAGGSPHQPCKDALLPAIHLHSQGPDDPGKQATEPGPPHQRAPSYTQPVVRSPAASPAGPPAAHGATGCNRTCSPSHRLRRPTRCVSLQEVGERPCRPSRITLGSPAPDHEGVVPLAHCLATSRAASAHTSPRAETTCCHARRSRGFCNLSSKAGSRIHGPGPMVVAHANTASAGNVRAAARDEGAPPPSLRPQDGQSMCSAHMAMHARGPGAADVAAAAVAIASTGGAGPRMRSTERRRRGGAV